MAQLTGNPIKDSYLGLIKTSSNGAMQNAGFENITDGAGNNTMLKMSQTELQLGTNIATQYIKQLGNSGGITEIKDKAFSIYDATGLQYALINGSNALIGSGANYFRATPTGSVIAGPLDLSNATINEVSIKGDGINAGKLKLFCEDASGAHNVTLEGPAHAGGATYSLKFPNVQSTGTQILEADSSGNLAWINTPSGGGGADTTYDLGSAQSTNDVDVTLTGSDATIDTIKMVAGTNVTLTDNGSNQITIDAAGGGGGDTPPMSMMALPQMPMDNFSFSPDNTWRANTMTTGTTLGSIGIALGNVGFTIWPMTAGETLNKVQFNINNATTGTGVELNLAIYDLTFRNGGGPGQFSSGIVPNDKVKDLGSIAVDTQGVKTIDISASPYIMPNSADYGAIAIAWSLNDPLASGSVPGVSGWTNAVWNGNSGKPLGSTVYRNFQPNFKAILDGTNNYALPSNLSDPTYEVESATSQPIWMLIKTEI